MSFDERTVVASIKRLTIRDLRLWVREGWVRPAHSENGPVFDELDIARLRLLCDLRKDLSLPLDALPVVLDLIDHLHRTRRELRALADAVADQPENIRRSVLERYGDARSTSNDDASRRNS